MLASKASIKAAVVGEQHTVVRPVRCDDAEDPVGWPAFLDATGTAAEDTAGARPVPAGRP
ncbi:hypothetical protein [Actinoplanes derwentensis]|uniref:hypothetical protein n=1 Tax=Actinoplanes derwentensis TaxID=113562 RepID=UPI000B8745C8|nr:hypothetical protein [Actinoplanes derwentensis]